VTQLSKQLSEHLVVSELARKGIIATPFSGNVPDFDILAFKNGKSTPIQVKSTKEGNITVSNATKDYLIIKQEEGNFQRVISKKEMPQWKKDLIFVVVFIGENLGEDRFYICKNSDIQEIIFSNYESSLQRHGGIRPRNPNSRHCAYSEEDLSSFKDKWNLIFVPNPFDAVCKLVSDEGGWCWRMPCTTCGNAHLRYAFIEMSRGKSPEEEGWITRKDADLNVLFTQFGSFNDRPRNSSEKEKVIKICLKASIPYIAENCTFPDWLGYLGLLLYEMEEAESYGSLSLNWAKQLKEYVFREDNEEDSELGNYFDEIINERRLLNWRDLERIESHIIAFPTRN
jgi:hypothetical protein